MEDRLHVLLRLRRAALDDARLAFAEAIAAEDECRRTLDDAEDAIERERRHATQGDDRDVELFAAWLRRARGGIRSAEAAVAEAEAVTANKRAEMTLVRAALEATENAIAQRAREKTAIAARAEQRELDELGARRQPVGEP